VKIGIVGLPLSGKSTVFSLLVPGVPPSADPSRPRIGVTPIPDPRVDFASGVFKPKKTTYASAEFVDFAGMKKASASDRGFTTQVLAQMRTVDALMAVVAFFDPAGAALGLAGAGPGKPPQPVADFRALMDELVLADLTVAEPRSERLAADRKRGARVNDRELAALEKVGATLSGGQPAFRAALAAEEAAALKGYGLLTAKPFVVVANCDEGAFRETAGPVSGALADLARDYPDYQFLRLSARIEEEIASLEEADRAAFLADLGLTQAARDRILQAAFRLMDLICFITVGEDEVRAWPIRRHTPAQKAAGRIHSDLEKGFIRAEVSSWADFQRAGGSSVELKKAGHLRLEGKEYVVQDGDVINIRFNVS
jgi:GTP-binding protein YchF